MCNKKDVWVSGIVEYVVCMGSIGRDVECCISIPWEGIFVTCRHCNKLDDVDRTRVVISGILEENLEPCCTTKAHVTTNQHCLLPKFFE